MSGRLSHLITSGLMGETDYTVRVTARHEVGAQTVVGNFSEATGATGDGSGIAGFSVDSVSGQPDEIAVSWNAVPGAARSR